MPADPDVGTIHVITRRPTRRIDAVVSDISEDSSMHWAREKARAEIELLAAYLNTSPSTVQKWEQGCKRPNGPSLKILNLVKDKGLEALQ